MDRPSVKVFRNCGDAVGEGPLWDAARNCLWWVDVAGRYIHRADTVGETVKTFAVEHAPAALALAADGTLVVAAGLAWYGFDPATGGLDRIAGTGVTSPAMRLNDGVVDERGRFWTGTLHEEREPVGQLLCLDSGKVRSAVDGLRTQNGSAISPDGKTFYLADSHPEVCTIWACDFDAESGTLENRRVFHRPERGRPDGAAIDADGCYWFAAVDGGSIVRLDPAGRELSAIELPVSRPTKPAFGGPGMSTVFVTSMRTGADHAREPLAGAVFAVETGVRGHPQPLVAGSRRRQAAGPIL
jgi:L-arabinonolactonase